MEDDFDDLTADIKAAMGGESAPTTEVESAPEVDEALVHVDTGASRDNSGRFAPKGAPDKSLQETPARKTDQPEAKIEPAVIDAPSIDPPISWSEKAREKFKALDPDVQYEVLKRERDIKRTIDQRAAETRPLREIDQTIAPHRERFQRAGIPETQVIGQLLALDKAFLERPLDTLVMIARTRGITPQHLAQQLQASPPVDPAMQQIIHQTQSIAARQQQFEQTQLQQQQAANLSQIDQTIATFRANPAYPYAAELDDDMAEFITARVATDLPGAYKLALARNPHVAARIRQDQLTQARKNTANPPQQRPVSATGSPAPRNTTATAPLNQNDDLEADLRAAFASSRGRI